MPSIFTFCLVLLVILATTATAVFTSAAAPRCPNPPNPIPIYNTDVNQPELVRTVKNGKLYRAGNVTSNDTFFIQHLYCTSTDPDTCAYEQGLAQGLLNKDKIPSGIADLYGWIEDQAEKKVPWLPKDLVKVIAEFGAAFALDLQWNITKPYTKSHFIQEMKGLADGSGMSFMSIAAVNMLAELIKADCSIILANNAATQGSYNGKAAHLRSLDGMGGDTLPIKDDAAFTVYHYPKTFSKKVVDNVNIGFISFIGSFTGIGAELSLGEKAWGSGAKFNLAKGQAWTFITREMLAATSLEDAKNILWNANRTCSVHLAQCSRSENRCQLTESAGGVTLMLSDETYNYPEHPRIKDIMYIDKFGQPTKSYCFADVLRQAYGNITAEMLALSASAALGSGDLHAATFDIQNQIAFFSTARKTYCSSGAIKACHRQWTRVDIAKLFAEPAP